MKLDHASFLGIVLIIPMGYEVLTESYLLKKLMYASMSSQVEEVEQSILKYFQCVYTPFRLMKTFI